MTVPADAPRRRWPVVLAVVLLVVALVALVLTVTRNRADWLVTGTATTTTPSTSPSLRRAVHDQRGTDDVDHLVVPQHPRSPAGGRACRPRCAGRTSRSCRRRSAWWR